MIDINELMSLEEELKDHFNDNLTQILIKLNRMDKIDDFLEMVGMENTVDNTLPVDGVIYHYDDGRWCRKYIEELYKIKNPVYDSPKSVRYTEEFIDLKIDFYKSIFKNPEPLWEKIREMNTGNTGDGSVC